MQFAELRVGGRLPRYPGKRDTATHRDSESPALHAPMVGGHAPLTDKFKMVKEAGFEGIDIDRHLDHDEVRPGQGRERPGRAWRRRL